MSASLNTKLILHVGLGKCGSSSLQKFLSISQPILYDYKVKYLGLNLELCEFTKYDWQCDGGFSKMIITGNWEVEYVSALKEEVRRSHQRGIDTLIVSNESFFGHFAPLSRVLKKIQKFADVHVIIVVRRIHELSCSSYMQWIIKDKNRAGPLLPFSDWIDLESDGLPWIHEELDLWLSTEYSEKTSIISLETSSNLIENFCIESGLEFLLETAKECACIKENTSDDRFVFLLRTIYQSYQQDSSPPSRFDNIYAQLDFGKLDSFEAEPASRILPTAIQVERFVSLCDDRVKLFNAVAEKHGYSYLKMPLSSQAEFKLPTPLSQLSPNDEVSIYAKVIGLMLSCIETQQNKIDRLEAEIKLQSFK